MRRHLVLVLVLCAAAMPAGAAAPSVESFLARHWRAPLAPQGQAPAQFSTLEASLDPDSCGTCHPAELADWRTSLHAKAMGPGVAGQLVEMLKGAPDEALGCYTCHAPLAEQRPILDRTARHAKNPAFEPELRAQGLVCAGCHVRSHQRFGPPRRDGTVANSAPRADLPHGGATRTGAFLAAEFCRACHQFASDGFALNGKLLENTYAEWKGSRFAREGVQCQNCHMPDRRHLWRGIHDRDMVRSGITVTARLDGARGRGGVARVQTDGPAPRGAPVSATLRLTNTRVGHAFPTYVTPRVVMRGELLDDAGSVIKDSVVERIIAREVELDLSRELRDTRLMPGRSVELRYRRPADAAAAKLRFTVVVEPDAFYTKFFETLLTQGAGEGTPQIREALDDTRKSPFTVFEETLPLR